MGKLACHCQPWIPQSICCCQKGNCCTFIVFCQYYYPSFSFDNIELPPPWPHSYAITVWYFDAKERAEAKEKYKLGKLFFFFLFSLKRLCPFHFPGFQPSIPSDIRHPDKHAPSPSSVSNSDGTERRSSACHSTQQDVKLIWSPEKELCAFRDGRRAAAAARRDAVAELTSVSAGAEAPRRRPTSASRYREQTMWRSFPVMWSGCGSKTRQI